MWPACMHQCTGLRGRSGVEWGSPTPDTTSLHFPGHLSASPAPVIAGDRGGRMGGTSEEFEGCSCL